MSVLAVLCYVRAKRSALSARGSAARGCLLLSAAALGLTAASKYIYCVAGVAIAVDWIASPWTSVVLREPQTGFKSGGTDKSGTPFARFGVMGRDRCGGFLCCKSAPWSDPCTGLPNLRCFTRFCPGRTCQRGQRSLLEAVGVGVEASDVAAGSVPGRLDTLITILAAVGLVRLRRSQRAFALWLIIGLGSCWCGPPNGRSI